MDRNSIGFLFSLYVKSFPAAIQSCHILQCLLLLPNHMRAQQGNTFCLWCGASELNLFESLVRMCTQCKVKITWRVSIEIATYRGNAERTYLCDNPIVLGLMWNLQPNPWKEKFRGSRKQRRRRREWVLSTQKGQRRKTPYPVSVVYWHTAVNTHFHTRKNNVLNAWSPFIHTVFHIV